MLTTIQKRLFYYWRVIATGISFAVFGLGGPIIAVNLAIFLFIVPLSIENKRKVSRNTIKASFKLYIHFMKACGLLSYEVRGKENIPLSGKLLIANHPTLLDVVFLVSIVPDANCIVKDSLSKNVFTRSPIAAANFISNSDPKLIERCISSFSLGSPLIIFPEGTRSRPNERLKFQRGAANIALAAGCDIAPVVIKCSPPTLVKHQKWYNIPPVPPHFVINFQPTIQISHYIAAEVPQCKAARRLTGDLAEYYTEKVSSNNCLITNRR